MERPVAQPHSLLSMTWPIFIELLLQLLVGNVDQVMLSQYNTTAVAAVGNANQVIVLPAMDKVIGTLDYVDKIAGGHAGSLREDGSIEAELQVITGATNEMGFNCLSAR